MHILVHAMHVCLHNWIRTDTQVTSNAYRLSRVQVRVRMNRHAFALKKVSVHCHHNFNQDQKLIEQEQRKLTLEANVGARSCISNGPHFLFHIYVQNGLFLVHFDVRRCSRMIEKNIHVCTDADKADNLPCLPCCKKDGNLHWCRQGWQSSFFSCQNGLEKFHYWQLFRSFFQTVKLQAFAKYIQKFSSKYVSPRNGLSKIHFIFSICKMVQESN